MTNPFRSFSDSTIVAVHRDLRFYVDSPEGEKSFGAWRDAAGFALLLSLGGQVAIIDVVCKSEAGAYAWQGSAGVERYRATLGKAVMQRIRLDATDMGASNLGEADAD